MRAKKNTRPRIVNICALCGEEWRGDFRISNYICESCLKTKLTALTAQVHRFTCTRCNQMFVCERPTSNDSSWNRYAWHAHECSGRGPHGYKHDVIDVGPFDPVQSQPRWSPYP